MGGGNLVTQYVYGNSVETFAMEAEVPLGKQPAFFPGKIIWYLHLSSRFRRCRLQLRGDYNFDYSDFCHRDDMPWFSTIQKTNGPGA